MLLDDHVQKCNIYDKSFIDDLLPYKLIEKKDQTGNNQELYLQYDLNYVEESTLDELSTVGNLYKVNIDIGKLVLSFNELYLFNSSSFTLYNTWLPVFIGTNALNTVPIYNWINNKAISRGLTVERPQLGIENFLSFTPSFKNWIVSSEKPTSMSVDWNITPSIVPFDPLYGILCWMKFSNNQDTTSLNSVEYRSIDQFPIGSRLISNDPLFSAQHFIKLDNTTVQIINADDSTFNTNGTITFNSIANKKFVDSFNQNAGGLFSLVQPYSNKFFNNFELWIPDGDFYSYINDEDNPYNGNISSRSYLSPCLFNSYTQIFNILTLDAIKTDYNNKKSIGVSRRLKRLSYCLATSPLSDHVTHEFLTHPDIKKVIKEYLSVPINYGSVSNELTSIKIVLQNIFVILQKLNFTLNKKTILNNYITSKSLLFKKLINKYRPYLNINSETGDTNLYYKNQLKHGDSIYIAQGLQNYCNKKLSPGQVVYNNQTILLSKTVIKTNIDLTKSEIILKGAGTSQKILPLSDIIKGFPKEESFTIGPDQYHIITGESNEQKIEIQGIQDPDFNSYISYIWESISGPCLRFGDFTKDPSRAQRFISSTDSLPDIYVYGPGVYRIKATVTTDFGTTSSTKRIYVFKTESDYNVFLASNPNFLASAQINKLRSSGLKIMCPNLSQIGIDKKGIFWPIKTDCFIGQEGAFFYDQFNRLEGQIRYPFGSKSDQIAKQNSSLSFVYQPANTVMKLEKIVLKNVRNETEECSQCASMHRELLYVQKNPVTKAESYTRKQRYPDIIRLPRFSVPETPYTSLNRPTPIEIIELKYPRVTTATGPKIKTYGGYNKEIFENIGVTIPSSPNLNVVLPQVTGYQILTQNPENQDKIACFQYDKDIKTNNNDILLGKKCTFYPNYGLVIETDTRSSNYSSVLKFNPGARDTFVFRGDGFQNMKPSLDETTNTITPTIYSSSITLNINPEIRPDPLKFPESNQANSDKNQKKELPDLDPNYGYRGLNNGLVTGFDENSDEFGISSTVTKDNPGCSGSNTYYTFSSLGPKLYPLQPTGTPGPDGKPTLAPGQINLQTIRVPYFKIQDLEVKLNFLNYVNTKNLVIWLDMKMCDYDSSFLVGQEGQPKCQLKSSVGENISPDGGCQPVSILDFRYGIGTKDANDTYEASELSKYLKALTSTNYVPDNRRIIRLYLLNQEHIQNNTYNFSIKFSDRASKFNKPSQYSLGENNIVSNQHIINNNDELQPTSCVFGYTDKQARTYRNIIDNNNIFLKNNSFSKYNGFELFGRIDGDGNKLYDSEVEFTLNIAVLDESDNMTIFDNTSNGDLLSGFRSTIQKLQSDDIYNSLCSWELILHTAKEHKFEEKGALGSFNYENPNIYPGYSYIIDMTNKQHLIPQACLNAPYSYLNNTKLCRFADPEYLESLIFNSVIFPYQALLAIVVMELFFMGATGTLLGLLSYMANTPDPAYQLLIQYFYDKRRSELLEVVGRTIDKSLYLRQQFGSGQKALISASKDGLIWYKMEASIFKYENCPVLTQNLYKYIGLHPNNSSGLSNFNFTIATSARDFIDSDFIRENFLTRIIASPIESLESIQIISKHSIVELTKQDASATIKNGFYTNSIANTFPYNSWIKLEYGFYLNEKLMQFYGLDNNSMMIDIDAKIANKKIIIIESRIPYDIFDIGDVVYHVSKSNLGNLSQYDPIVITSPSTTPDGMGTVSTPINTNASTGSSNEVTVVNKLLFYKNNKYYCALELSNPVILNNEISDILYSKSLITVFNNRKTIGEENNPFNKWGFEKTNNGPKQSEQNVSSYGIGTYGQGSAFLRPNVLSHVIENNKIDTLYERFNNIESYTNRYANINLYTESTGITLNQINIKGYSYSFNEVKDILVGSFNEVGSPINYSYDITNVLRSIDSSENNIIYLKSVAFVPYTKTYGSINFSNDYVQKELIGTMSAGDREAVINRINLLSKSNESIVEFLGIPNQTYNIINNGSISDLQKHYSLLPEDNCFSSMSLNDNCYKLITKETINKRNTELNNLIKSIELDNEIVYKNTTNQPHGSTSIPAPLKIPTIKQGSDVGSKIKNNTNSLYIEYNSSYQNSYWINIDPKQQCNIDDTLTLKILTKAEYECSSAIGNAAFINSSPVCPKDFIVPSGVSDPDIEFTNGTIQYTYTVPSEKIQLFKNAYPQFTNWRQSIIRKSFLLNNNLTNENSRPGDELSDTFVNVIEYYDVAVDPSIDPNAPPADYSNIPNRVYSIFNLANQAIPLLLVFLVHHKEVLFPSF